MFAFLRYTFCVEVGQFSCNYEPSEEEKNIFDVTLKLNTLL